MQSDFSTAIQIQGLLEKSRNTHMGIYDQWCQIGTAFAEFRGDLRGHDFEHLDGNIDLILRMIEADQLMAFQEFEDKFGGGVLFVQIGLSKMWLFSVYEMVRMNCAFKPCEGKANKSDYCGEATCLRCKLRLVRDRLSFFRVPLAKLEPERRGQKRPVEQNYRAEMVIDKDNGSVGWRASSLRSKTTETTSRLVLSDFVLDTLAISKVKK